MVLTCVQKTGLYFVSIKGFQNSTVTMMQTRVMQRIAERNPYFMYWISSAPNMTLLREGMMCQDKTRMRVGLRLAVDITKRSTCKGNGDMHAASISPHLQGELHIQTKYRKENWCIRLASAAFSHGKVLFEPVMWCSRVALQGSEFNGSFKNAEADMAWTANSTVLR